MSKENETRKGKLLKQNVRDKTIHTIIDIPERHVVYLDGINGGSVSIRFNSNGVDINVYAINNVEIAMSKARIKGLKTRTF